MSTHFARGSHRFVMEIPASGKVPTRCLFYAHPSPLCFILLYFPIWWIDQAPPLVRCSTFFWRDGQLVVILRQCHLPAPLCAVLHYAPTAFVVGSQQPQLGPDDFADKSHGSYQFILEEAQCWVCCFQYTLQLLTTQGSYFCESCAWLRWRWVPKCW